MAVRTLLVLLGLVCCSMAVPQVPTTFYTKMSIQLWNGSKLTFQSTQGFMAQHYDRKVSISCFNYTDEQSYQLQTQCEMSMIRSSNFIYIYYIESVADQEILWCEQSDMGESEFFGTFDWVNYTRPMGMWSDTCNQDLEKWQYDVNDISSESISVADSTPDIPASYKYVYNTNTTTVGQQEQYIICFDEFLSEVPPTGTFLIPGNCQSSQQTKLRGPKKMKYRMPNHLQHKMKLKHRTHNRL